MAEKIKQRVKELLESGKIKGFLGLVKMNGHVRPHLFDDPENLDGMVTGDDKRPGDTRYPLNKQLVGIARAYPGDTFGVLVRGCDERGLNTLFTWNQLHAGRVVPVGIACAKELAEACECAEPFPTEFVTGEKTEGAANAAVEKLDGMELAERFDYWMEEFYRCIKCYGCRNICPVCFCGECSLASKDLVDTDELPPETPIFHLTRAMHMAGRCIDCGLCQEACPSGIPLRTLYKKVGGIMEHDFGYKTGAKAFEKSPLNTMGPAPD